VALPNPFARRPEPRPTVTVEPQPDDLPKTGLFAEPVRVAALKVLDPEVIEDGRHRVTFLLEIRDAEGRRCPDLSVEARVSGPERARTVQGTTDLFGRIRFRMASTAGDYHLEVTDVAARGLDWDRAAGPLEASIRVE
jgi:hypothetical protein